MFMFKTIFYFIILLENINSFFSDYYLPNISVKRICFTCIFNGGLFGSFRRPELLHPNKKRQPVRVLLLYDFLQR